MRIFISEAQLQFLVEQEEILCVPTGDTQYVDVDISVYDIMNRGKIIHYGDRDSKETGAIKVIQRKLGIKESGKYDKRMLKQLSLTLGINLCEQKDNEIPIGPKGLTKLRFFEVTLPEEGSNEYENYIIASTLIGERGIKASEDELFAIYSTIKNRSSSRSMVETVLKPKQYSTWNRYNRLSTDKDKLEFLTNRISVHKEKGFDEMLTLVQKFRNQQPLKYNHYVNPSIVDLENSNRAVAKSYRENKKNAKQIGKHTFWWDKKHK